MPSATEFCQEDAGRWSVLIDRNRCEGKEDCVRVCPEAVFQVRKLTDEEFDREVTGWLARLKVRAHKKRQAFAVNEDACRHCRRCEEACPEKAIAVVARL